MTNSLETPQNITVKSGDAFYVKINAESEGSTGDHWEVINDFYVNKIKFITKEWIPDNSAIGSSGIDSFEFKADDSSKGSFKLNFVKETPNSIVDGTLSVDVTVV